MIEKDLKMIEEYLATFHLELSKVQNQGISIVGREFDIRQAIVDTQNKITGSVKEHLHIFQITTPKKIS